MGIQNNPFQDAYLLRYNFQPSPRNPEATPDNPETGLAYQSFLQDFQRNRQMGDRTRRKEGAGPDQFHRMAAQLFRQEQERGRLEAQISHLEQQLADSRIQSDPARRREIQKILEARKERLSRDSFGLSGLRLQVSQGTKGLTSGFVGSENRVDAIGSFVVSL